MAKQDKKMKQVEEVEEVGTHASLMTITPAMATEWLAKSTNKNRKTSHQVVLRYAEDIRAGRWQINGQTIVISKSGHVIDGRHRLLAIIEAHRSIQTFVISGVEDETFETMDSGKSRSPADVLGLMGYANITELAALGRLDVVFARYGTINESHRLAVPSTQDIVTQVNEHADVYQRAIHETTSLRRMFGTSSIFTFYWLRLGELSESDRDFFYARLNDGLGLLEGDPVYALRQAFLNAKTRNRQMSRLWVGGMLIKAWNRYRNHQPAKIIYFNATEEYPTPV